MRTSAPEAPLLRPAWFKHAFWRAHRLLHRLSGGRFLWTPASKRGWGALRLSTTAGPAPPTSSMLPAASIATMRAAFGSAS
ncbi:MAG: hypothetical protein EDR02_18330 [Actinobacteria bacterium]|nr:MAG: hypothetical protein EDR02_18330 [Actinomycetota bacterium]RIK02652.1 MAG: hypothetical protein DCC48_17855 [Acidobacteriota bacterium]